jgi:uncharacterized protein
MDLPELIDALGDPAAYPAAVDAVEVRQTHISVVFLTGEHVYKIKKPVKPGFVDFSTLSRRRHYCEEEVRLNARLAAEVYLGVVPIVDTPEGIRVEADGRAVEWAVKMKRLPDEATLESRLERGAVDGELIDAVARHIADFHARAETSEQIAAMGRHEIVAGNARGNFEQSRRHVGTTISRPVAARLQALTDEALAAHRTLIDDRAARGVVRDTHGDLRLDHIYVLEDRGERRLLIIDCIEFNEQFRFADPVADMAFLAMDLKFEGRGDLAEALADTYFAATGDHEGRRLLPLYTSYRAAVRGKVEGFRHAEAEVPAAERADALVRARGYWLLALAELEQPEQRPCLVLVGGLPGSGKSTLAADLAGDGGFQIIRSDEIRKTLAGAAAEPQTTRAFGTGLYSAEWNERTYAECLRRAEGLLFEGGRVVIDASFREEARRREFLDAAARWRVPGVMLVCQADAEVVRRRLSARQGDVSDADWGIYLQAAAAWEPAGARTATAVRTIASGGTRAVALEQAVAALGSAGLAR